MKSFGDATDGMKYVVEILSAKESAVFFFPSVEPPERTNVSLVINPFLCGDFLVCPKIKCHKCFFLQSQPAFFLEVIRTLRVGILLENSPPENGKWTVKLLKFGIWPKNVMGDHRHPGCIGASLIFSCLTVVESVYWYISTLTYQFQSAASNETHGKLSLWMSVWLIGQTNRFPAKHLQHLQEDLGMSFAVLRHIRDQFKAWRR